MIELIPKPSPRSFVAVIGSRNTMNDSVTDTTTKETTFYIHTCFDEASSTETNVVSNNFLME